MAAVTFTFAQSSRKKRNKDKEEEDQEMPSSLSPNKPQKEYKPKKSKSPVNGPTFESDEEYRKRMEAVVKQKQKDERLIENPQYSDPMYFGHKRPPKKHKPSKMKYCKVCGIRH
jgi:hypothetical protein